MVKWSFLLLSSIVLAENSYGTSQQQHLAKAPKSYELAIDGRSIADHCRYIYRIETELRWQIDIDESDGLADNLVLVTWLFDLYDQSMLPPQFSELEVIDGVILTETSLVTMSTNPRYLSHEMYFTISNHDQAQFAEPHHKLNFSALMQQCYDWTTRNEAPFRSLEVYPIRTP